MEFDLGLFFMIPSGSQCSQWDLLDEFVGYHNGTSKEGLGI